MADERRRLQIFRNNPINVATSAEAKALIEGKKGELLDGELIVARYSASGDKAVLGVKGPSGMAYFDSAALETALQSVQAGKGISIDNTDANNPIVNVVLSGSTIGVGEIKLNDGTNDIVTMTGLTATNVTYDGENRNITKAAVTVDGAIAALDSAVDALNNMSIIGDGPITTSYNDDTNEWHVGININEESGLEVTASTVIIKQTSLTYGEGQLKFNIGGVNSTSVELDSSDLVYDASSSETYIADSANVGEALQKLDAKLASLSGKTTVYSGVDAISVTEGQSEGDIKKFDIGLTIAEDEKVLSQDENGLKTTLGIRLDAGEDGENARIVLYGIDEEEIASFDAGDLTKDAFLSGVTIVDTAEGDKAFQFVFKVVGKKGEEAPETIIVPTKDLLGDIQGGDGIDFNGAVVKIDLADQTNNKSVNLSLDGTTEGSKKLNVNVSTNEIAYTETPAEGAKKFTGSDNGSDIADATTTVSALNTLQDEIDAINSQSISGSGAIKITGTTSKTVSLEIADDSFLTQTGDKLDVTTSSISYDATGDTRFAVTGDNGVATGENVASMLNELQDEIDDINAKTHAVSGSNAITVETSGTDQKVDTVSLKLSASGDTTIGEANALVINNDGLFLSNIWDCGTF